MTALPQTKFATQINKAGSASRSDDDLSLLAAGFRFTLLRALSIQSICNRLYMTFAATGQALLSPLVLSIEVASEGITSKTGRVRMCF